MAKRVHEEDDAHGMLETMPLISEDGSVFKQFNHVASVLWGVYFRGSTRLVAFAKPQAGKDYKFRRYLHTGVVDRVIDIYNNLDEYNNALYLTQKKGFVCGLTVPEVKDFNRAKYKECELIKELFADRYFGFNVIYPLYQRGMVVDVVYGPRVLTSIMTYLRTADHTHVDDDKCITLLNQCVEWGIAQDLGSFHIPIPTAQRFFTGSIPAIPSIYHIPTANFSTIAHVFECRRDEFVFEPVDEIEIKRCVELPKKCTLLTCDESMRGKKIGNRVVHFFDDHHNSCTNVVFVFKNNGTLGKCEVLHHCMIPGMTRLQSLANAVGANKTFWVFSNYNKTSPSQ